MAKALDDAVDVVLVDPKDSQGATTAGGQRISADYVVLASGSSYPYPAKMDVDDTAEALTKQAVTREQLASASRVLLVGAGPVGLEFAGEITDVWPDKEVTIVLRVAGHDNVFAIGDVTGIAEPKLAAAAHHHAQVVADSILTLVQGRVPEATYRPGPDRVVIPLGATGERARSSAQKQP